LKASDLNWIINHEEKIFKAQAKIRSTQQPTEVNVTVDGDEIFVKFDDMQKSIAIGQSVVIYNEDLVLGGGIITEVI
jgi:tRNA-specific 2-thiouridylase